MKTNPNDNAYPIISFDSEGKESTREWGLSKREYFAAMAMQGILSNTDIVRWSTELFEAGFVARMSCLVADATINQLNQSTNTQ